jgi:uncharacterized lipoprotein YajG
MRHVRTTAAVTLAAALLLAGCSSSKSGTSHPSPTTSPAAPASPAALSSADAIRQYASAIQAGADTGDTQPPECASLSLDGYYEALHAANKQGQDALQSAIDNAQDGQ